ncbi:hypothetical protein ART_2917 [Arthrobacter sp. PAMC 25486]|nr:hypothetical protein ART_2917 [Arthrobacter sp. PAMC 25486]
MFGERDATVPSLVEYGETADRSRELLRGEANLTRTYDAEQARATHLHLFQDLYDWSGSTAQSTFSRAHPVDLPTSTG